ncbi:hypothetical protein [Streptomyces sp. NPDC088752]|uniref:hypothetical protein n=1 Tax=Streptomyces sp. NPDC088752 TaxID=3154963 RepID=UPI003412337D
MSDLERLAELWQDYVDAHHDGATRHVVRALYLIEPGGGAQTVFLHDDGTAQQCEYDLRSRQLLDLASGDAARCLELLTAALSPSVNGWAWLLPEGIRSIRTTLTDTGLTAPDLGLWEVFAATDTADVRQHDEKG